MLTRKTQGKIFISYRRDDARGTAGRLMDTLGDYFGDGRVFRDIESIEGGANFEEVLSETVGSADAVIVLIGPNWLNVTDGKGQRRLNDPNDWVSHEIATALQQNLPVFPVLIEDTPMPRIESLPDPLKPLVRHNAISVSDNRWEFDVMRLAKVVAFDVPGSAIEKKLDLLRLTVSLLLFATISVTTGIVAWNTFDGQKIPPLQFWQSGVPFVVIIACSVLLLLSASMIDTSRRWYVYASGLTGLLGSLVCYTLVLPLNDLAEPISNYFGSTVIASAILVLMNLSGFKPK